MEFSPKGILFAPTTNCNLNCPHCATEKSAKILPAEDAEKILRECKKLRIERVGFTGGEPFLSLDFLCDVVTCSVKNGILFDRIMTNGVWYQDRPALESSLGKVFKAGYDGDICISVDSFHEQDLKKVAFFIETALNIWKRPDIISIACTLGLRDRATYHKLKKLCGLLDAKLAGFDKERPCIKSRSLFIKIYKIALSPTGRAEKLQDAWDGRWFKEDYCKGPGNILFIMPDGSVKPCCGYATDAKELTIGNIKYQSAAEIIRNAKRNRFVRTIFNSGLSSIRKRLEGKGWQFPGKTSNHCYFCYYAARKIPKRILKQCLDQ